MNRGYNTAINLYRTAARIASLGSGKIRRMIAGQAATASRLAQFRKELAPDGFDVWFHAASLGEFEQARPVIEALLSHRPDIHILVSFFSPSGYEVRHSYDPRVAVVYMPFDTPENVRAFLDAASPRMAVFVKYEFWGNYLCELRRRGIETYIISAIFRPGQIFFRPWGGQFRRILRQFSHLYVQDEQSRMLLESIGISSVTVAGDTRFDRVTAICRNRRSLPVVECFKGAAPKTFTIVAGSSWQRDEDIYFPWLRRHPEFRAIIAPHEFDAGRLASMKKRLGEKHTMLYSELEKLHSDSPEKAAAAVKKTRYLIMDCFGLLSSLYRYADCAYVGGGFGAGIHNINEAAVYGIPVIFGPRHQKFNEAAALIGCGGGFCVRNRQQLADVLSLFADEPQARIRAGKAAGHYIASNVGATALIMNDIFDINLKSE